jgi:hypothetical protein
MSEEEVKGDPNPTRLMQRLMDKLDGVLVAHGFEFDDENKDWGDATSVMERFVFHFYTDLTGGDEDYDPNHPPDVDSDEEEVQVEGDDEEEEEEAEFDSDDDDDSSASKKVKSDDGAAAQA